jgi:hypothetical protein
MRLALSLLVIALGTACGGGDGPEPSLVLSVGGTYQTAVSLLQTTCVGTQVQTFPTTVTHTPGSSTISLSHAGSTYPGSVDPGGAFRSPEAPYTLAGTTYRISITGSFSTTAMDATVTVTPQVTPPCSFTARWQGPKTGAPNVIP